MEALRIKPTKKQIEAHKALHENNIVLYGGAVRGAKSYWGCLEIIGLCFKYPKSRWLMLRRSWDDLKGKLIVTFNENFINKGFNQYVKSFDGNTMTLTWNNGSQIVFMSESFDRDKELNRFRGLEINGAFIDEVNEIQEATFNKIIERSGSWFHSPGCPVKILMSCNPTQNWVKKRFYDKWKTGKLQKGISYIQAHITDNPYVPQAYLDNIKFLPPYEYEVFVLGNWDIQLKTGGEFYKYFELEKHTRESIYNPLLPLHISFDENVNPYLPCAVYQIDGTIIRQIDEITGVTPRNTVKDVCNEFKTRYYNHKAGLFIYGDATSRKADVKMEKGYNFFTLIVNELKQFNPILRVPQANPSVAVRGNFINQILYNNFADIVISIGSNCKETIADFINLKEAADGTKAKITEKDPATGVSFQKYGHLTDCFDYMICEAFRNQFLTFQRGGVIENIRTFRPQTKKLRL